MLSVDEAFATLLREIAPFPTTDVPLCDALGLVLAESVSSDIDSPPFDKALMDGYAVRVQDVGTENVTLHVIEEVTAGRVPVKSLGPGEATRIMTGAPLPVGADAVVRNEETEFDPASISVNIRSKNLSSGANLMRSGTSFKTGDEILSSGTLLQPQTLGALAELGRDQVLARRRPKVAVLATGDELVPVDQTPGAGQIRNSNETMLVAQLRRAGALPVPLGIARDNRDHLGERIRAGLECDMLLLSGGVSAGKLDLVPSELEAAGVRQIFHQVKLKPGKPVWFGVRETPKNSPSADQTARQYVFGLPGNPVSSMVCCELFTRTAIRRLMGFENAQPQPVRARMTITHQSRGDRPVYHPARSIHGESGVSTAPIPWRGSADLCSTVQANGMILFPAGERTYQPGEEVDVYPWDS